MGVLNKLQKKVEIGEKLNNFISENNFNVDESGHFFKHIPRKTLRNVNLSDKKLEINVRDPGTACVCTNAIGKRFMWT